MADKPQGATTPDNQGPDTAGQDSAKPGQPAHQEGFPSGTTLAEMTPEQREAYWKVAARKHEDAEKALRVEVEAAKAEAEKLRLAAMSEAEKAIEAAKAEAKLEGVKLGAAQWQKTAVAQAVRGHARASGRYTTPEDIESVDALLSMIDPSTLVTKEGELDEVKIAKALSGLAAPKTEPKRSGSGYMDTLSRQGKPGPGSGSVAAVRAAFLEAHTQK